MIYSRKEPHYALCGLNCCLCPRFNAIGSSRCPGCGGKEFSSKHPTCAVVTCSKKHGNVEFCFECSEFPCERYEKAGGLDSFITYRNVLSNFAKAKFDLNIYMNNLRTKYKYLRILLEEYDDKRSKSLFCMAVELLPTEEIGHILKMARTEMDQEEIDERERSRRVVGRIRELAKSLNIDLVLRK